MNRFLHKKFDVEIDFLSIEQNSNIFDYLVKQGEQAKFDVWLFGKLLQKLKYNHQSICICI